MDSLFVGIDWADQHHDICIMHDDGSVFKEFRIRNDSDGFTHFDSQLKPFSKEQILICIETNHGLLFEHLLQFNYRLFPINPGALVDYRKTDNIAKNKNDKLDARLLADYIRKDRHRLREHKMNSESTQILKLLTEDRQRLLKEKIRMELQLIDTLKLYFPAALKLFSDITNRISLAFLSQYPTPEKAKKLTLKRFQSFLRKHKYTKPGRAEEIFSILQQDYPIAPEIFVQAKERFVKAVIPQILVIVQQLDDYDREIKKHYDLHPDKDIFHTLPGIGKDLGPAYYLASVTVEIALLTLMISNVWLVLLRLREKAVVPAMSFFVLLVIKHFVMLLIKWLSPVCNVHFGLKITIIN